VIYFSTFPVHHQHYVCVLIAIHVFISVKWLPCSPKSTSSDISFVMVQPPLTPVQPVVRIFSPSEIGQCELLPLGLTLSDGSRGGVSVSLTFKYIL
jgi:hypothetical protein